MARGNGKAMVMEMETACSWQENRMGEVQKIYLLVSTFPLTQKSLLRFDHEKNGQGQR